MVSPYLQRRLRSLDEVLGERESRKTAGLRGDRTMPAARARKVLRERGDPSESRANEADDSR